MSIVAYECSQPTVDAYYVEPLQEALCAKKVRRNFYRSKLWPKLSVNFLLTCKDFANSTMVSAVVHDFQILKP